MQQTIDRFVHSLLLEPKFQFKLNYVEILSFTIPKYNHRELYHGIKDDNPDHVIDKIKNEGFRIPSRSGNKDRGRGIYFSSHGRYQYLWLNHIAPIMICDVLENEESVKRYRSEIGPGYEFVVTDPKLIIPKCVVQYEVTEDWKELEEAEETEGPEEVQNESVYTPPGEFGCPVCDPVFTRCDCELLPTFEKD